MYIVYEINKNYPISSHPTIFKNCLFGVVKLTKHPDDDKYKCYGIVLDLNCQI